MSIVRWDPFKDIDKIFNRYGTYAPDVRSDETVKDWAPAVDIHEAKDKYTVRAELPGVEKDNVSVSVDDAVMTIKGAKQFVDAKEGEKWKRVEAQYGEFTRSFTLPDEVDSDSISAAYKDGVLELSIPKVEPKKAKMIDVQIH